MEWSILLVPILVMGYLKYTYPRHFVWWEVVVPMLPVFVIIPLVRYTTTHILVTDTERWGGWVLEAKYYEDWNEQVWTTCSYTDSKGNTKTRPCLQTVCHPEEITLRDSNNGTYSITRREFEYLAAKFGNRKFVDQHRHYYTNDGDLWVTKWEDKHNSLQTFTSEHTFVNKMRASRNVMNYPKIRDPKGLYAYPRVTDRFHDSAVLGTYTHSHIADLSLQDFNALEGCVKQVRCWLLIFHDKPLETGYQQESYWVGGKKNEFVCCINISNDKITWVHSFCWSPDGYTGNDLIKIALRDEFTNKPADLLAVVKSLKSQINERWKRKSFKEFDYLSVDLPPWIIWIIFVLTAISTAVLSAIFHGNEYEERQTRRRK